jgi:hypothetical protein
VGYPCYVLDYALNSEAMMNCNQTTTVGRKISIAMSRVGDKVIGMTPCEINIEDEDPVPTYEEPVFSSGRTGTRHSKEPGRRGFMNRSIYTLISTNRFSDIVDL